jgi:integrase/recombinase XerD
MVTKSREAPPAAGNMARWIERFLDDLVLTAGRSQNTLQGYRRDLKCYEQCCSRQGVTEPGAVGPQTVGEFLELLTSEKKSPATVARALSAVRSFHRYLLHSGVTAKNPARSIRTPRLPRKLPGVVSVSQMQKILAAPDSSTPQGIRDRALLALLYGCGLRVSEAAGIRVEDVNFAEKFVRVLGKGGRERLVPFGRSTERAVKTYLNGPRVRLEATMVADRLFLGRGGKGLSRMGIWLIVRNAAKKSGLEKRVHPHTFRHSFATHLLQAGADLRSVQAMLGHRSVSTTQIYAHLDRAHLADVHRRYHPLEAPRIARREASD